ncbi:MAG: hypothetical protein GXP55_22915 [Deltaproteobacteria bacterium]|nr:hypothetical protein [Deltaproteobacteria bacterium]
MGIRPTSSAEARPSSVSAGGSPRGEGARPLDERAQELRRTLASLCSRPIALTLTDNRRSMVVARRRGDALVLRLHHMFLEADPDTLRSLLTWVERHEPQAGVRVDAFVTVHRQLIRPRPSTAVLRLTPMGRFHDLRAILEQVACRYLEPEEWASLDVRISWGKRAPSRRRRSIQLGSYVREDRLIRVHRALDAEWVPRFFVEAVVYHELLHHQIPVECVNGRRRVHTPEFRVREALFERHADANAFERDHLGQLLRS